MATDLPMSVVKAITRELQQLHEQPCEGIKVLINEHNIADIQAEIEGPTGTPYEGGLFRMRLMLGPDYPTMPPKGYFTTKIFHPNVSSSGEICVNVLKKDWNATLGTRHVLLVIRCLLIEPFPESALNEEAGKLLLENYEEYAKHAKLLTSIHAQPPKRPMPLTAAAGNGNGVSNECGREGPGSPAAKKAKADKKAQNAAAQVKKSLKRL